MATEQDSATTVLARLLDRLYPPTDWGPGASALGAHEAILAHIPGAPGVPADHYAAAPFVRDAPVEAGWQVQCSPYEVLIGGLQDLDAAAHAKHGAGFADLADDAADHLVRQAEAGELGTWPVRSSRFLDLVLGQLFEQLFVVPAKGAYEADAVWEILEPGESARQAGSS